MDEKDSKSLDVFGIKPVADTIRTVTEAMVEGASAFLSRICLPAAEEFGLLVRDRVHYWRAKNRVNMLQKAEEKLNKFSPGKEKRAHPRLVAEILNKGSWEANEEVQDMWAGLLASACTNDGSDESNLVFINILAQLTSLQAKILNYGCENAKSVLTEAGWIMSGDSLTVCLAELRTITGCNDLHRLDRELDQLRNLGLIGYGMAAGGFGQHSTDADITPTGLALQMYVRCKGFIGDPSQFFGLGRAEDKTSN
jgi:hypothetical protein